MLLCFTIIFTMESSTEQIIVNINIHVFIFHRYMKGRMNYSQVNTAIDELNKAFSEKYKVLGMKRTTLNDLNKKRYERYKEQESKDTKGQFTRTFCLTNHV